MADVKTLMAELTDEQVEEYASGKYPPSVQDWAKQEQEARKARREQAQAQLATQIKEEQAREGRKVQIAKITKALGKVWTDDLTNVLITREEVDDTSNPEEVEVNGEVGTRYPKVLGLVVRTNIFWTEKKLGTPRSGKLDGTRKLAITIYKRDGTQLEAKGNFRSGAEACKHLGIEPGKDSANRALARDSYIVEAYQGSDFTLVES